MSLSKNINLYTLEKEIWEKTLEEGSFELPPTTPDLTRLRARLYMYRTLLRERTREILDPLDPDFDTSPYDEFRIKLTSNGLTIRRDPLATTLSDLLS